MAEIFTCDALVVGGGAAGIAAAIELSRAGLSVELAEQRASLGGAYHRQPANGVASAVNRRGGPCWARLIDGLDATPVKPLLRHVFLGLDSDGLALLDDRQTRRTRALRARAVIVAVGAIERVLPRPGWQLDGVVTAGGLQMLLKETGSAPHGEILIAGNGPLTVALAADLARLSRPPIAVIEAGDPLGSFTAALKLAPYPGIAAEALSHLARVQMSGARWLRGTALTAIDRRDGRLVATLRDRNGKISSISADLVALHDGIRPNDFGLPATQGTEPLVIHAGDCREALGIRAAQADGMQAARNAIAALAGRLVPQPDAAISRQRRVQDILFELFAPVAGHLDVTQIPDETILCRCEGRSFGDLRSMLAESDPAGLREIKLNGRFGMGLCQGRFCADTVKQVVAATRGQTDLPLSRDRWPLRPVSIEALVADEQSRGE